MLRIKKDIPLEKLEEYGFEYKKGNKVNYYEKMIQYYPLGDSVPCTRYYLTINEKNRHIYTNIWGLTWQGKHEHYEIEFVDDLFDLIQDGLVEKVEEED